MLRSTVRGETPTPLLALPWGSRSMSRVRFSAAATLAATLTAVVVFPTPPFWLTTAMTWARRGEGIGRDHLIARSVAPRQRAAGSRRSEHEKIAADFFG